VRQYNKSPWWIKQERNKHVAERTKEGLYATRQKHQRFYQSKEWKQLSAYKKSLDPLCEGCLDKGLLVPGEDVHHTIPIAENWSLRLSLDHLLHLCKQCHSKITVEESVQRRKKEQQQKIDDCMDNLNDFYP
jgi:5-methylcytosine-specific restriction endonuclease McrA